MDLWMSIAAGIGLSAACGFRVFVPLLLMSVASLYGYLPLSSEFAWLSTYPALAALGAGSVVEVLAYYIPWLDNLLDTIATPAAIGAGTLASASVLGGEMSPFAQWALAAISGGGAAGLVQGGTVAARGTSSASTGGAGNFLVSTVENIASVGTTALAIVAPLLAVLAVVGLLVFIARRVRRRRRRKKGAA